jgi:hypothetical protein
MARFTGGGEETMLCEPVYVINRICGKSGPEIITGGTLNSEECSWLLRSIGEGEATELVWAHRMCEQEL